MWEICRVGLYTELWLKIPTCFCSASSQGRGLHGQHVLGSMAFLAIPTDAQGLLEVRTWCVDIGRMSSLSLPNPCRCRATRQMILQVLSFWSSPGGLHATNLWPCFDLVIGQWLYSPTKDIHHEHWANLSSSHRVTTHHLWNLSSHSALSEVLWNGLGYMKSNYGCEML